MQVMEGVIVFNDAIVSQCHRVANLCVGSLPSLVSLKIIFILNVMFEELLTKVFS